MDELPIQSGDDVVRVRQRVRVVAADSGLSLVDQTKVVTAASELARNALVYGGGGTARIEAVTSAAGRAGVRIGFGGHGTAARAARAIMGREFRTSARR